MRAITNLFTRKQPSRARGRRLEMALCPSLLCRARTETSSLSLIVQSLGLESLTARHHEPLKPGESLEIHMILTAVGTLRVKAQVEWVDPQSSSFRLYLDERQKSEIQLFLCLQKAKQVG